MLPGPLTTRSGEIRDALDRRVMLRGANLSGRHKMPPFLVFEREQELDPWAAMGWNVMRLVIPWESIEPERGRIDRDQLDRLATLARWAGQRGIHVIADFHQDLYARALGGSGAPAWTLLPEDVPTTPPDPDRWWFLKYATSEAVRRSLARFWTNADGIQDRFIACVSALAERLAHEPAVIGLAPWNEPFPGDRDFDTFEINDVAPLHRKAMAAAREKAPHWLAFVEGTVLASEVGTALDLSDIGGVVYNPHFYDKIAMTTQSWSGDLGEMNKAFKAFVRDAERMGTPWMLGEYGCARDTSGKVELLKAHQNALLAHGIGGTVWNYDPSALDWNDERMGLDEASLAVLAHPYPTAIHGQFRAASLDGVFTLDWMSDGVAQPTDVALPDLWKDAAIESSAPYTLAERRIRMSAPAGPASLRLTPAV